MMGKTKILDNKKRDLSCKSNDRDDSMRPRKVSFNNFIANSINWVYKVSIVVWKVGTKDWKGSTDVWNNKSQPN